MQNRDSERVSEWVTEREREIERGRSIWLEDCSRTVPELMVSVSHEFPSSVTVLLFFPLFLLSALLFLVHFFMRKRAVSQRKRKREASLCLPTESEPLIMDLVSLSSFLFHHPPSLSLSSLNLFSSLSLLSLIFLSLLSFCPLPPSFFCSPNFHLFSSFSYTEKKRKIEEETVLSPPSCCLSLSLSLSPSLTYSSAHSLNHWMTWHDDQDRKLREKEEHTLSELLLSLSSSLFLSLSLSLPLFFSLSLSFSLTFFLLSQVPFSLSSLFPLPVSVPFRVPLMLNGLPPFSLPLLLSFFMFLSLFTFLTHFLSSSCFPFPLLFLLSFSSSSSLFLLFTAWQNSPSFGMKQNQI